MTAFLGSIWHTVLFAPLLNLLIFLYNGFAHQNLGLAVVFMTILLRLVLLPFSIISEWNRLKYERIEEEIDTIEKEFKDDPIEKKTEIRKLLKGNKIRPWSSAVLLGIQFLTLVLLYQVFVGGTQGKLAALYPSVPRPDIIYTHFAGIDIAVRNLYASLLVGVILYAQIWKSQVHRHHELDRRDVLFRILFPLFSFLILFALPSVKTVFILTSMAFSYIIHLLQIAFAGKAKKSDHGHGGGHGSHDSHGSSPRPSPFKRFIIDMIN